MQIVVVRDLTLFFRLFQLVKRPLIYLVFKKGQKLSTRTAPEKGYAWRTTIKVPIERDLFEDLFSALSRGRSRFDVMAKDLDTLSLMDGRSGLFEPALNVLMSRAAHIDPLC